MKMNIRRLSDSEIHTRLLQDLGNNLTDENFEKMKNHCKGEDYGKLGSGQLEKIKTPAELFKKLEQMAIFKEGDYEKLKRLLDLCESKDAIRIVEAAEKELCQAGRHVKGYPYPGSNAARLNNIPHNGSQRMNPQPYSDMSDGPSRSERHRTGILSPESVVSRDLLLKLSTKLGNDWKFIGRLLGLTDETLEYIRSDNVGNEKEMAYTMLSKWKEANGQGSRYKVLEDAFKEAERVDLVDKVKSFRDASYTC